MITCLNRLFNLKRINAYPLNNKSSNINNSQQVSNVAYRAYTTTVYTVQQHMATSVQRVRLEEARVHHQAGRRKAEVAVVLNRL